MNLNRVSPSSWATTVARSQDTGSTGLSFCKLKGCDCWRDSRYNLELACRLLNPDSTQSSFLSILLRSTSTLRARPCGRAHVDPNSEMYSPRDVENQIHRLWKIPDAEDVHSLAQQDPGLFPPAKGDCRSWNDLGNDALTEIFIRLPFEDRLRTLPFVCKGWRATTLDPACWRNIDMEGWFKKRVEADYWWESDCEAMIERLVKKAVDWSCGQLEELRTRHCTDATLDYIADRCPSLSVLSISKSLFVTDRSVAKLASSCPQLKVLDVSDCYNISNQALEAVGLNCKALAWLSRNMVDKSFAQPNLDLAHRVGPNVPGGDEEAIAVSTHMVNLKHLEMMKTSVSNKGLAHLARGCGQLESLNLACCKYLSPEAIKTVSEKCPNIVEFTKPIAPQMHVHSYRLRVLFG